MYVDHEYYFNWDQNRNCYSVGGIGIGIKQVNWNQSQ